MKNKLLKRVKRRSVKHHPLLAEEDSNKPNNKK
jgi:hypothetical protein